MLTSSAGEVETSAKDLGLAVDVDATVDGLVGFSLSPATLWHHLAGGVGEPAVVTVDDAAFAAAVEKARGELDAEPVEGSISVARGQGHASSEPVTGTRTDVAGHRGRRAALVARREHGRGRGQTLEPKVSAEELGPGPQ